MIGKIHLGRCFILINKYSFVRPELMEGILQKNCLPPPFNNLRLAQKSGTAPIECGNFLRPSCYLRSSYSDSQFQWYQSHFAFDFFRSIFSLRPLGFSASVLNDLSVSFRCRCRSLSAFSSSFSITICSLFQRFL